MRFYIFLLVALALLLAGAEAKYSPGLEIASGAGIAFSGAAPETTADVLYSDGGTLMFGDTPIDRTGIDTITIYQTGANIVAKSHDGYVVATGTVGTDDLAVLHAARDYCHTYYPEGATIALLNGRYEITTFQFLYGNLTLKLKKGVVIEGNTNLEEYPIHEYGFPTYTKNYVSRSMFWAEDVQNIGIIGEGEIDGNGEHANFNVTTLLTRPFIIRFCNVSNFRVGGENEYLKLYNAAMWSQHYLNCSSGIISKQLINTNQYGTNNKYRYLNLDGLGIDCSDRLTISDLDIVSGDDAIVIKASGPKNCTNITISNCALSSNMAGIKFGTESNGGFQNFAISNINIFNSRCGIGIATIDGGYTCNINVNNINMQDVGTPFYVRLGIRNRPYQDGGSVTTQSTMKSIVLDNILVNNPTSAPYTSYISGYDATTNGRINGISVRNFRIVNHPGGGTQADSLIIPSELPTAGANEQLFGTLPAAGLYVRHVTDSQFEQLALNSVLSNEDRPGLVLSDVSTSRVYGVNTQRGTSNLGRVFLIDNSRVIFTSVSGSIGTMFNINGASTNDILLLGNDCGGTLMDLGAGVKPAEIRAAHNPD